MFNQPCKTDFLNVMLTLPLDTFSLCPDRPWAKWPFPGNLNVIEVFALLVLQTWNISSSSSHNRHSRTGWRPTLLTLIESCAKSSKNEFNCICSKNLADNIALHTTQYPLYNGPEKKFYSKIKFLFDLVTALGGFLKSCERDHISIFIVDARELRAPLDT